jgi:propionyl-CoA carboxylase beta chain
MDDDLLERFDTEQARADAGGGRARQARQHRLGRWTARERLDHLLDPGSFVEIGRHRRHAHADLHPQLAANRPPGDGVICGFGAIDGRTVAACTYDPTVLRGAVGSAGAQKRCQLLEEATRRRLPVITVSDSNGARIAEGVHAIVSWGRVMEWTVRHREVAPHLTLVPGLCVGAAAYDAELADFTAMVAGASFMFLTSPAVTTTVTGEHVDIDALGGHALHAETTGSCHAVVQTEQDAVDWARAVLSYTQDPHRPCEDDPARATPKLRKIIPAAPRRAYDARKVLRQVFDADSLLELSAGYAPSLMTCFGRLGGRSVAILANQTMARGGCLDIDSSRKGAEFLRYADTHGLPVITLVDTPGYLPGLAQEAGGVLREGARLIRAYAELSVPTISVTLRKSYGGANVMATAADLRLALPLAEIAPMGEGAAARVALGPEVDGEDPAAREAFRAQWRGQHGDAWLAAERGFFDAIVHPDRLRADLHRALERLV